MKESNYGTAARYRELAFGVLKQAVHDYYDTRAGGSRSDNIIYDINPMWFVLTGVNPDWFYEKVIKEGDRRYAKRFLKNRP